MLEVLVAGSVIAAVMFQSLVTLGLFFWGRWVAGRQFGALWRYSSRAPFFALAFSAAGYALTVVLLARSFEGLSLSAPEDKARLLGAGISRSMNLGAVFWVPAQLLYAASVVIFLVGSIRKPTMPVAR